MAAWLALDNSVEFGQAKPWGTGDCFDAFRDATLGSWFQASFIACSNATPPTGGLVRGGSSAAVRSIGNINGDKSANNPTTVLGWLHEMPLDCWNWQWLGQLYGEIHPAAQSLLAIGD